jgi:uncharacterized protein (TIGR02145 family)
MALSTESVKDIEGNEYKSVKIGNQIWTVENLRTTKYNDNSTIPLVTDAAAWDHLASPGYCWNDNDIKNKSIYGALYNWYAVDTKKLAPKGWHVPADAEWNTLENYLIANGYNWDGTTKQNKIATSMAAKADWTNSTEPGAIGNGLTEYNRSGFSALPGGCRNGNGGFHGITFMGFWWSSTRDGAISYHRDIGCGCDYFFRGKSHPRCGFSVRLIRD